MRIKATMEYEFDVDVRAYLKHVSYSKILAIESHRMEERLIKFAEIVHSESPHLKIDGLSMTLKNNT